MLVLVWVVDSKQGKGEGESRVWLLVVEMDLMFSWTEEIKFRFLSIPVSLIQEVGGLVMRGVVTMVTVALLWVVALAFFSCCLETKHL